MSIIFSWLFLFLFFSIIIHRIIRDFKRTKIKQKVKSGELIKLQNGKVASPKNLSLDEKMNLNESVYLMLHLITYRSDNYFSQKNERENKKNNANKNLSSESIFQLGKINSFFYEGPNTESIIKDLTYEEIKETVRNVKSWEIRKESRIRNFNEEKKAKEEEERLNEERAKREKEKKEIELKRNQQLEENNARLRERLQKRWEELLEIKKHWQERYNLNIGTVICGIYAIRNTINNNIYIGSSRSILKRKESHYSALRNGKHHSFKLQEAFDEYGESNLEFHIIKLISEDINGVEYFLRYNDINTAMDKFLKKEKQKFINRFSPYYNVDDDATGKKHWRFNQKYRSTNK